MRTVQMTLDDEIVELVDRVVKKLHTTRSAFTRAALQNAVRDLNIARLEEKHRRAYKTPPVGKAEFSVWEKEQEWGDR